MLKIFPITIFFVFFFCWLHTIGFFLYLLILLLYSFYSSTIYELYVAFFQQQFSVFFSPLSSVLFIFTFNLNFQFRKGKLSFTQAKSFKFKFISIKHNCFLRSISREFSLCMIDFDIYYAVYEHFILQRLQYIIIISIFMLVLEVRKKNKKVCC